MGYPKRIRMLWLAATLCMQAGFAQATPEVGWWWNPNESGRGFFIESQNGIMYMAGYLYESDGRATWVAAGGPNSDPYSYSGRLNAPQGGQTLFGDYKPPTTSIDSGAISVTFADDKHGVITWPGGSLPIERTIFDTTTAAFQPNSGWWWNASESGRGFSVEVQGGSIVVAAYMYDDDGKPVWYYSAGKMSSPTTYEGAWLQFANGQSMTGTYRPPAAPVTVGRLSVEFTASDEATLTISDNSRVLAKASRWKMIYANRTFASKPNRLPDGYDGNFSYTAEYVDANGETTWTVTGHATWIDTSLTPNPLAPGVNFPGKPSKTYELLGGSYTAVLTQYVAVEGGSCTGGGGDTGQLLPAPESLLQVSGYAQYVGAIKKQGSTFDGTLECLMFGTRTTTTYPAAFAIDLPMKGIVTTGITGTLPPSHPTANLTVTGHWFFLPSQ